MRAAGRPVARCSRRRCRPACCRRRCGAAGTAAASVSGVLLPLRCASFFPAGARSPARPLPLPPALLPAAIRVAVGMAKRQEVVVVAGKGHVDWQEYWDGVDMDSPTTLKVRGCWAAGHGQRWKASCSRELTVSENCGWGLHCAQRRCIVAHVWCACLPGVLARSHTLAAAHAPPCPSPHPPLRSLGLTTGWSAATRCPSCRTCRWGLWAPGGGLGHASQPTRRQAAARAAQRTRLYYSRQLVLAGSLQ